MGTLQTRRVLVIIIEIQLSFAKLQRREKEKQLTFNHTCLGINFYWPGLKPKILFYTRAMLFERRLAQIQCKLLLQLHMLCVQSTRITGLSRLCK